ncbi:MAG: hypothetical protein HW380_109 [Magnetococcales bacterium]|nr:hypothetical protein [Magnetococcales bacterium]HIJ84633.1 hypothetical protein [Magnetococcales bacterium]
MRTYRFLTFIVLAIVLSGCATVPYERGRNIESDATPPLLADEPQVERGRPVVVLDGLGHYLFSLPSKFILWNWQVDNHDISQETEEKLKQYLHDNDLNKVKVRLNQYSPGSEWSRLFGNESVGAGWRYTVGVLSVAMYTIFPGRLLGGDNYNPFTNTIHLYSDHKSIAVHEAGHAKDFAKTEYKGTQAVFGILPLVPLFQEADATGDAIGYNQSLNLTEDIKDDYKILYPAYGTYVVGEGLRWINLPLGLDTAIRLVSAVPGHIVGRIKAAQVEP